MTLDELKTWSNRGLSVAGIVAALTPTSVDDMIVGFLKGAAANDDVMNVILALINLLAEKKVANKHAVLTIEDVTAVMKAKGHVPS